MARYRVFVDSARVLSPERFEQPRKMRPVEVEIGDFEKRGTGLPVDEESLERELDQLIQREDISASDSDPDAALKVRSVLNISRRDAANKELWTFLNCTAGWKYCVWRWIRGGRLTRSRISGGLDRSALARLWWMAELVGGESPSGERLQVLLRNADRAVQLFERPRLLRRRPLMRPLIEVTKRRFDDWDEDGYRAFAASTRAFFGVRLPEAIPTTVIGREIEEFADRTTET